MSKLTLSIDDGVIRQAKRYARRRGASVSKLVEAYLDALCQPPEPRAVPPILRSLRGSLKKADVEDYRRHLARKYR